jgi:hypothetical protein
MNTITLARLATFVLIVHLAACNSGSSNGGDMTPDTTAPTGSVNITTLQLGSTQALVITFSETMNTGTLVLGGALAAESNGGVWSAGAHANDTLTISPATSWTTGSARNLTIKASDLAGNPLATMTLQYDVYAGSLFYVSSAASDDTGNGSTPATAKRTIMAAINAATAPATVLVNAGSHAVDSGAGTHVVVKEGVSLLGGFNAGFSARDPATYFTDITATANTGGTIFAPNRAIDVDFGVTAATVIDGFRIQGGGGDYSAGIMTASGGSAVIRNNQINGGSGEVSYGILVDSGSPLIENNTVWGGAAGNSSYGIYNRDNATIRNNTVNGGSGVVLSSAIVLNLATGLIELNTLHGGSGSSTVGVSMFSASTLLENNTIDGGDPSDTAGSSNGINISSGNPMIRRNTIQANATDSSATGISANATTALIETNTISIVGGGSTAVSTGVSISNSTLNLVNNTISGGGGNTSMGIQNFQSAANIRNNTINGGTALYVHGIRIWNASSAPGPVIQNNIVFSGGTIESYCISELNAISDAAVLQNNDLFSCATALYLDFVDGTGCAANDVCNTSIANVNLAANTTQGAAGSASANVSVDPVFADIDGADNDINTMGDNDWHLSAGSPASVKAGGLNGIDQGWSFTTDKDGVTRPASGNPWSIGAYEP